VIELGVRHAKFIPPVAPPQRQPRLRKVRPRGGSAR